MGRVGIILLGVSNFLLRILKNQSGVWLLAHTPEEYVRGAWRIRLMPLLIMPPVCGIRTLFSKVKRQMYGYLLS
jgi:hypothetical protein